MALRIRHLLVALAVLAVSCGRDDVHEWSCVDPPARPPGTVIAGSGATLPIARELVELYESRFQAQQVYVAESIGTGGALRAIADGAIDIGLASRSLENEPVNTLELLNAPIRIAGHPQSPDRQITWEFLMEAAAGDARWSDGTPVVFIHREAGDSGTQAVTDGAPELARAIERGRARASLVAYTDGEALRLLTSVPGALSLYDPVTTRLTGYSVRELELVDGPEWRRPLSVFWVGATPHFVQFLQSADATRLLQAFRDKGDVR